MSTGTDRVTLELVREAAARLEGRVVRTPVLWHTTPGGARLALKVESLQPTGAFKIRGAYNLMATLPADCPGVVAHSSGNHAQAVARAGAELGIPTVVVMPSDAPRNKRSRTEADGAEIVVVGTDSAERARRADELVTERGLVLVPPFDHPLIAAGQGTAALELLADVGDLDRFYAPISGGGLMAGCAVVVAALAPHAEIVGVEPVHADAGRRSLAAGDRVTVPASTTIADGLRVRSLGEITWPVIRDRVRRIETVSDDEMLDTMAFALEELRLVLEPSGAAALALALREAKGTCGVVLSGGNVDPDILATALARRRAVA